LGARPTPNAGPNERIVLQCVNSFITGADSALKVTYRLTAAPRFAIGVAIIGGTCNMISPWGAGFRVLS
jgi:hypothetical protein